ncbi:hypothetical protein [Mycobacterium sp. SMC-4]|uniref:hypothetical protein n=1 Tax=Mycobacterium sp. SMC-4 TaxID=2857059 RepID=UPI0021B33B37|nr:hypothetical protein [Mycobacterium sp. SMC-4]UXA19304.1 hypothetical protein KXD98_06705 [Mycobacterium sp. SMC-4]
MTVRTVAIAVLVAAAVFVGAGPAGARPADSASPPPVNFNGGCGLVAYPATGVRGIVTVTAGPVACIEAMRIVDRYLHDPTVPHAGTMWSSEFEGWLCVTPTSDVADEYGYLTSCLDGQGSEIQVTSERDTEGFAPVFCDPSAIATDIGEQLSVQRCYGTWAYVSTHPRGGAQSLLRLVDGAWTRYTDIPTDICRPQAEDDGVPIPELHSFVC